MSIIEDAWRNLAQRERVQQQTFENHAGYWSLRRVSRAVIPEDTPDEFHRFAKEAAENLATDPNLPGLDSYISALMMGVQLGREIERLAGTGRYPLVLPEE